MEILSTPISSCSREHQKIYQDWFSYADSDNDGRITGNDATKFFSISKLSRPELKQVWAVADSKRQGFLGFREFITAMQLIALAQAGKEITPDVLATAELENLGPPLLDGLDILIVPSPKKSNLDLDVTQYQSPSFQWFTSKSSKKVPIGFVTLIIDDLKKLYIEKLKPLETNSDFDVRPMVRLLGQYSTGKTIFIKHLLNYNYPGVYIGPEPTTDRFVVVMEIDVQTKQRAAKLKEELKKMLLNFSDSLQELNLINEIQRLGVAYHFEKEIKDALYRMHDAHINGNDFGGDLHAVALWFRLLRQQGYNVSSNVFRRFKDKSGEFKETLKDDIQGLLSLYEAAYLGTREDNILDEAINFTTEHLKSAMSHLSSPLSTLVQFALDLPLHKRVERLQSRYYISIYQEEMERNDILLEFAKLDFNMLQSLHKKELSDLSRWWKENDFSRKLPFIRDRVVECYLWILGVYFEPHYSQARRMMTRIICLISVMDDIYDVYGTMEELELFTAAIDRWEWAAMDQLPDYIKVHYNALLSVVEKFEYQLSLEGKSYRIPYLKKAFTAVAKTYLVEARWANTGYVPTLEEYMKNALLSSGYPALTLASLVGMGDIATKETFEWAINIPKVVQAIGVICRLKDDITSNELEQERTHVASAIQCYMKEHNTTYKDTCKMFREKAAGAWKDLNLECMEPIPVPREVIMRQVNLLRVIELLYQNRDLYTNSADETKEHITMVLVDPIPV